MNEYNLCNAVHMTQKQVLGAVVGVGFVIISFLFVYQQYTQNESAYSDPSPVQVNPVTNQKKIAVPVPEKLNDITAAITAESIDDFSALDEELAGATAELDADSDSVNNLGTSYDENSL